LSNFYGGQEWTHYPVMAPVLCGRRHVPCNSSDIFC
jgi:hypothetical protein